MICPKCLHEKTKIYNSRFTSRNNQTWRRHKCLKCGFTFSTREYIEADQYLQVISSQNLQSPYSRTKLLLALAQATAHADDPEAAFYLLGVIENKLLHQSHQGIITTRAIITTCLDTLQAFDAKAYLAYLSAYAPVQDHRDLKKMLKRSR
jgi:transcriptional repressor NrdR